MSEQKETKNMKNAAEAQAPEQNTTEPAAKQNDDAKQADTTEQNQQLSRMMMLSRLILQNSRRMLLPSR